MTSFTIPFYIIYLSRPKDLSRVKKNSKFTQENRIRHRRVTRLVKVMTVLDDKTNSKQHVGSLPPLFFNLPRGSFPSSFIVQNND